MDFPLDLDDSELSFFKSLGEGRPKRLFVGGLHGEEHLVTDRVLEIFADRFSLESVEGEVVLCSLGGMEQGYISTLKKKYWESNAGRTLLRIVDFYSPSIYLELHSYSNYSGLTDPDRIEKEGVPPLVDLKSGILAGSVSPFLRTKFRKKDFCFLLDLPGNFQEYEDIFDILSLIASGNDRLEIVDELREEYPEKTERMIKNYISFYHGKLSEKKEFGEE